MGGMSAPQQGAVKDFGLIDVVAMSATIGSGGSTDLVTAADNPAGLYLWSASITADGAGIPASTFQVTDTITDSSSTQYLALQVAMTASQPNSVNVTIEQDMHGILVPAGLALVLNNGGAGGNMIDRQCSATVIYTQLV